MKFRSPKSEINALEFCIKWTFEKWVCENLFRLSAQCNSETEVFPIRKSSIETWKFFYLSTLRIRDLYKSFLQVILNVIGTLFIRTKCYDWLSTCHWNSAFCTTKCVSKSYNNQLPHFGMIEEIISWSH